MSTIVKRMPDGVAVLLLAGRLNSATLESFKAHVSQMISEGFQRIIVDCQDIGYISSSGLAALLWARSSAGSSGRKVYLTHVSALVSEVLQVTRLTKLFRIEPTTRGLLEKLGRLRKSPVLGAQKRPFASSIVRR